MAGCRRADDRQKQRRRRRTTSAGDVVVFHPGEQFSSSGRRCFSGRFQGDRHQTDHQHRSGQGHRDCPDGPPRHRKSPSQEPVFCSWIRQHSERGPCWGSGTSVRAPAPPVLGGSSRGSLCGGTHSLMMAARVGFSSRRTTPKPKSSMTFTSTKIFVHWREGKRG